MTFVTKQVWVDDEEGPNAFQSTTMSNQALWDGFPLRADEAVCTALHMGGFDNDHIQRKVANYEGQIMAIRRGYVKKDRVSYYAITEDGCAFLRSHGYSVPVFLPAFDSWHGRQFEYCLWEYRNDQHSGTPYLEFAKELYPRRTVGMKPL